MTRRTPVTALGAVAMSIGLLAAAACAPAPFDRYLAEQKWTEAAQTFSADSALMNDERALFRAGELYGSPDRPTYDPARAQMLLRRLLSRFPDTRYRADASTRLALLDQIVRQRDSASARERQVSARMAQLETQIAQLRAQLDSNAAQSDLLRRSNAKLESDLRDRDEQLRALRLELKQLKDIDLRSSAPGVGRRVPRDTV